MPRQTVRGLHAQLAMHGGAHGLTDLHEDAAALYEGATRAYAIEREEVVARSAVGGAALAGEEVAADRAGAEGIGIAHVTHATRGVAVGPIAVGGAAASVVVDAGALAADVATLCGIDRVADEPRVAAGIRTRGIA